MPRSSACENPNCRAANAYSPESVVAKMAGSSVLSVIGTPASNSRRTGCASSDSTAPVATLLVIHTSSGIPRSRKCRSNAASSTARMPCPMRSAPISSAVHTDSGPTVSPACAVSRSPAVLANRYTSPNHAAGARSSSPPIPNATTPSLTRSPASSAPRIAPPDPNPPPPIVAPPPRQFRHPHRVFDAKVPDRVQNPMHLDGKLRGSVPHSRVDWRELLPLPEHHSRRQRDFGVLHCLGRQLPHQGTCDARVVLRHVQPLDHRLVRLNKSLKTVKAIHGPHCLPGETGVQLLHGLRLHGPFQGQMQLRFRPGAIGGHGIH